MQTNTKNQLITISAIVVLVLAVVGIFYFSQDKAGERDEMTAANSQPQKPVIVYNEEVKSFVATIPQIVPETGETKVEMKQERPEVRLKKWDGEVDLGVSYKKIEAEAQIMPDSEIVKWFDPSGAEELHAYLLEPTQQMESGGVEIEVILNEPPGTNTFDFQIDGYEELDFFYQPKMIPEDLQDVLGDGAGVPENVKGSYAVYHKTNKDHQIGSINYATGKVFHIYRPKAIDNAGNEVWGELNYEDGVLSVTIPHDFLDNAVYPVRIDPIFGYATNGGFSYTIDANQFVGSLFTSPSDAGEITSISAYSAENFLGTVYFKGVIILNSDLSLVTNGVGNAVAIPSKGATWATSTLATAATISGSTVYILGIIPSAGTDNVNLSFDIGGDSRYEANNYTTPTGLTSPNEGSNKFSIYATYTEVSNYAPTITSITDSPDPVSQGSSVTFDFDWNDADAGDLVKTKLCSSSTLTNQNCAATTYASSSVFTTDDPETLTYSTKESDGATLSWWGFVCDDEAACSAGTSGNTTISTIVPSGVKLKSGTLKINLEDSHWLFIGILIPAAVGIKRRKKVK